MSKSIFNKACLFTASFITAVVLTAALSSSALAQGTCGPSGTGNPVQEKASCDAEQPASQNNANEPAPGGGNPINIITGNKYQQEVDLPALPGELGIEVVRHYNSLATSDSGHLGRGWRLSYETEIRFEGAHLTLIQADGKRYTFKCDGALCRTQDWADGVVHIRTTTETNKKSYVWRWLAGNVSRRELTFDDRGLLLHIRAASGSTLTIQRFKDGRIQEVIDPQGRKLMFHYPSVAQLNAQPSRFDGVIAIDTPLGRVEYGHGSAVPLAVASDGVTTLKDRSINTAFLQRQSNLIFAQMTGAEYRDIGSPKKQYQYESLFDGQHAYLTGISINGIRQSTYLYDKSGLAVLSTKGEPARLAVDASGAALLPKRLAENTGVEQIVVLRKTQGQAVLVNSLGKETVYKHAVIAGQHRLLEIRGPGCSTCGPSNQRYEYSKLGLLGKQTALDANGSVIQSKEFVRDSFGRIRIVKADTKVLSSTTYESDFEDTSGTKLPLFELATVSSPSLVPDKQTTRTLVRNSFGQIVSATTSGWNPLNVEPVISRTTYAYEKIDGKSVLVSVNAPGSSTTYRWDEKAIKIVSSTLANSDSIAYRYDEAGRVTETLVTVGERAVQTKLKYLALNLVGKQISAWFFKNGKPDQTTFIEQNPLTFKYNHLAQLVETIDIVGRSKRYGYDGFGRLVSESDAAGYGANISIDTEGNIQRSAATHKNEIVRANYAWHDDYGRVIRALQPDGRMDDWQFDARGRVASHFNSDNVQHRFSRGKAAAGKYLQISEALDGETRFLTNLASAVVQKFDDLGRIVFQSSKDHGSATFDYDDVGRLKEKVRSDGVTERFTYDESGGVALHSWIDSQGKVLDESSFQYQNGALLKVANSAQETYYEYDAIGRITAEHVRLQGLAKPKVFTTKTEYDSRTSQVVTRTLFDGRVMQTIYADIAKGAHPVELRLDSGWFYSLKTFFGKAASSAIGAIIPSSPIVSGMKVSPLNGLEAFTLGNGLVVNRTFDSAGRLKELNNEGIGKARYKFEIGPRVRGIEATDSQPSSQQGVQKVAFNYSSFGELNSTFVALDDQKNSAQYVPNKFSYNVQNQLKEIFNGVTGAPIANYSYNASHQRVRKVVFGEQSKTKERFYLWQANKIAAEVDGDGNIVSQYVYLNDGAKAQPIAQLNASEIFYIHNEYRGAPAAMTDADKNVVWKANLNINGFAKVEKTGSGVELNLRLPGQYFDAESNLHDNFHRTYNPSTGRYLQADPLGYPDGPDSYLYASGDPVNRVDPLGLYEIDVHYYMTFFLARAAGIGYREALTIASATQYIDENPRTWPVDEKNMSSNILSKDARNRLASYHFTTSPRDVVSFKEFDPERNPWEKAVFFSTGGQVEAQSYVNRRFQNPTNDQLTRLSKTYFLAGQSRCERAQFFGEYLHAFEDSFGHRNQTNVPIELNAGLGHGVYGHSPDKTYNHSVTLAEVLARPDVESLTIASVGEWSQNESRTLRMEQEVFEKMKDYRVANGIKAPSGKQLYFGSDLSAFFYQWNKITDFDQKKTELNFKLNDLGLGGLPEFDVNCAKAKRDAYLWNLDANPIKYEGAILQVTTISQETARSNVESSCQ
jgi:RHS repeat-associated protein